MKAKPTFKKKQTTSIPLAKLDLINGGACRHKPKTKIGEAYCKGTMIAL